MYRCGNFDGCGFFDGSGQLNRSDGCEFDRGSFGRCCLFDDNDFFGGCGFLNDNDFFDWGGFGRNTFFFNKNRCDLFDGCGKDNLFDWRRLFNDHLFGRCGFGDSSSFSFLFGWGSFGNNLERVSADRAVW